MLLATLVAGTLDISYAIVANAARGIPALAIWQSVASGLLGKAAYQGGAATAVLGGVLHFAIMGVAALTYYLLSRRAPRLVRQPFLWGPLFGIAMFVVMNYAVVPLSAIGHPFDRSLLRFIGELFSHVAFVGLPIAWFAARAGRREEGG
jgi:hypothetical protein